jgi:hypothetical protein
MQTHAKAAEYAMLAEAVRNTGQRAFWVDDEIVNWLERRERRKASRAKPNNYQGHRSADAYRTAKHYR